jgi:molybdenum cofactor cytidylyltransferase
VQLSKGVVKHVGVLLAAGAGARFGGLYPGAKLDQLIGGIAVGVRSFENLAAAVDHVVVVVRDSNAKLAQHARAKAATVLVNSEAHRGMGHSLATAATYIHTHCIEAQFIWVSMADLPFIKLSTFDRLSPDKLGDELQSASLIVQPVCERAVGVAGAPRAGNERRVGHPVIFGRAHWAALAALDGDAGARSVVQAQREHLISVQLDDEGIWRDIDTPSDLLLNR